MIYISIFLLNVADLLTTHLAVNVYQVAAEANPIMAAILGSWVIVPVKLGLAALMVYLLWRARVKHPKWQAAKIAAWGVLVFYTLVVINNSLILLLG